VPAAAAFVIVTPAESENNVSTVSGMPEDSELSGLYSTDGLPQAVITKAVKVQIKNLK
jgi:hypothetical protein